MGWYLVYTKNNECTTSARVMGPSRDHVDM